MALERTPYASYVEEIQNPENLIEFIKTWNNVAGNVIQIE